jgi:hypothetical protein
MARQTEYMKKPTKASIIQTREDWLIYWQEQTEEVFELMRDDCQRKNIPLAEMKRVCFMMIHKINLSILQNVAFGDVRMDQRWAEYFENER